MMLTRIVVLLLAALGLAIGGSMAAAQRLDEAKLKRHLKLPEGFEVNLYASGLGRARLMVMTPRGDILLSSPSPAGRVLLIERDADGDGRADGVRTLIKGMRRPHGLWLEGDTLYIAAEAQVFAGKFDHEKRRLLRWPEVVLSGLPDDGGHWTRTIKKGPDGYFYVSIGSKCNVCIERHPWRATIIRFRPGEKAEVFARGLRNTVGFDWRPEDGALYGVDNGRDWLGDELPPDELNRIERGGHYGWPYVHGAGLLDPEFGGRKPRGLVTRPQVYGFRAHVAPLSIRFLRHTRAPQLKGAALVAQHGSWNRSTKIGYQVVSLHWQADGTIVEKPFLSGFLHRGGVSGRPVDVLEAPDGTIYVSDDYAGVIWRVTYKP